MSLSSPFIARPVATTLLTLGVALAGFFAFLLLPVAPLPQVDFPAISVTATLPGASPETVAASVAAPLERRLGQIADVVEMTSMSTVGNARITLLFGLSRDIDGAARDVQAAINASRADLPTALRSNPTYRKVNPADAPILILALTSKTKTQPQLYDSAATVLEQKLSQVEGIGQVQIGGSSLPAVRVELQPGPLFRYGIGLEDVRAAIAAANANSPKGAIELGGRRFQVYTNDQARHARDYRDLPIAYRNGAVVRLSDVAEVMDGAENRYNLGLANGSPSVLCILYRQPGANIIATVERVKALVPELQASIPRDIDLTLAADRSTTIRASLHETELTLAIAMALVVGVVFLFLRSGRAVLVPAVAVPVSIVGTFSAMYLLGYSIDNLSLMALTIATGFVVDDAIVVLENIARHVEAGQSRVEAALEGAREVGFTVLSMSVSLVAVFLPILLMGGLIGRIFREFAVTLSLAIAVSLVVSLTTTPMMCRYLLAPPREREPGRLARWSGRALDGTLRGYERSLGWTLRHPALVLLSLAGTIALNVYLFSVVPKGLFPDQDTGRLIGGIQADQSISFSLMREKLAQLMAIVRSDPTVETAVGFTGGGQTNSGFMFVSLKPYGERDVTAQQVVDRLRPRLAEVPGARLFLSAVQDFRMGGRQTNANYQFTLQGDSTAELYEWAPKLVAALADVPQVTDVSSDQQQKGLETQLVVDRATAARLGLSPAAVDNTLYDAFGQRQVSTIYNPLNQYHVVMELSPEHQQDPDALRGVYVSTSGGPARGTQTTGLPSAVAAGDPARNQATNALAAKGRGASSGSAVSTTPETMVPLSAFADFRPASTALAVNHQGPFVATTISFNLPPGVSLGEAAAAIRATMARINMPATIHGGFAGTAAVFVGSLGDEPLLILAAIGVVYIVLGILYESLVHPITILSTLPSAGVGAVLALMLCGQDLSIIALIGVFLLIGIVKKNAIMMVDVALDAERREGLAPREAILRACSLRFRPIMMTTFAAILGALPLAIGVGEGAELRQPLGISIVGGLVVSQILTLYTTPVVYLCLERLRLRRKTAAGALAARAAE